MKAHSVRGVVRWVALATALAIGGWLLASKQPAPPRAAPSGARPTGTAEVGLRQAWPKARVVDASGTLPDGQPYLPGLYLDADTSIGTAPTADQSAQRVVLRSGAELREVHRVAADRFPQFLGFTAAGDDVYWAESTSGDSGPSETRLWRAPVRGGQPVSLTTDTGGAVFFNSQHDLVVQDGRVYWVAAANSDTLVTEVRSVPVTGGPVRIERVDGAYQLSAWPWLQTAQGVGEGPLELRNLRTGQRRTVPVSSTERAECSPAWCRSIVTTGADGTTRYDLMKPDGSDRRRVGGATVSAATADVAVLDRFEAVMQTIGTTAVNSSERLVLYDIKADRIVTVADGVGMVVARQHVLWWSTGDHETAMWHSLDLANLPA